MYLLERQVTLDYDKIKQFHACRKPDSLQLPIVKADPVPAPVRTNINTLDPNFGGISAGSLLLLCKLTVNLF